MVPSKSHSISLHKKEIKKNQKLHLRTDDNHTKSVYNLRERLSSTKKLRLEKMAAKGFHWSLGKLRRCFNSTTPSLVFNNDVDIQVPIGPLFQAEVPEWTGLALKSDAKWLGTRIWPLEKKENKFIGRDQIGKGRQDSCGCLIPDSIQCVKIHIVEKRLKLKLELGLAFYQWKFDKMGEDVAFSWKKEDKKMFSSIVKSNPSSRWDEIYKYFHDKSKKELVSYYFNVFILQHRAYQNRTCPMNISWDDEEILDERKLVTKGIIHKATKSRTSILIPSKKSRYSSSSPFGIL